MQEKSEMKPVTVTIPIDGSATGPVTASPSSDKSTVEAAPEPQAQYIPRFRMPTDPKFTKKYHRYDKAKVKAAKAARKMTRLRRK